MEHAEQRVGRHSITVGKPPRRTGVHTAQRQAL